MASRPFPLIVAAFLAGFLGFVQIGCQREAEWTPLFDGQTLDGWQVSENPGSAYVADGAIVCGGDRAHVFYVGDANGGSFKNFELKADVMARPGANSGIYFHTAFQDEGWPSKGFEIQVNNSAEGEGGYRELKRTGSLYGIRNVHKQIVGDDEWFNMHIVVRANRVQSYVNGALVVDYVQPELPEDAGRRLDAGTFALQCHDPHSEVHFKNIVVRSLPEDLPLEEAAPVDDVDEQILALGRANFPMIDLHVHLKGGLTLDQVLAKSRRDGINVGIAPNCGLGFPIQDDAGIYAFLDSVRAAPVYVGMQAEGREWVDLFSTEAISRFDYVFTDAMTFTHDDGRRMRLWIDGEVGEIADAQAFMDMYVDRIVGVVQNEPIDIYVNPTFLPTAIRADYDALWTDARMRRVIDALAANQVAMEINSRYRIPSAKFVHAAKAAGVKLACGTNNAGADDLGRSEYCLEMVKEADLKWQDMYVPLPGHQRILRKRPV
jgi:hypothetical protein